MADREKVLKGLQELTQFLFDEYKEAMTKQEIAENYDRFLFANDALNLLKAQEAVKPEKEHSGSGVTWWNVCGNCRTVINPNDKYCHECGRAVKWE